MAFAGERVSVSYRQASVFDTRSLASPVSRGEGTPRVKGGIQCEVPLRISLADGGHMLVGDAMYLILARFSANNYLYLTKNDK